MDHFMAEKVTKKVKAAKWGKPHQKVLKKELESYLRRHVPLRAFSQELRPVEIFSSIFGPQNIFDSYCGP
jgi:hypothetical protein